MNQAEHYHSSLHLLRVLQHNTLHSIDGSVVLFGEADRLIWGDAQAYQTQHFLEERQDAGAFLLRHHLE